MTKTYIVAIAFILASIWLLEAQLAPAWACVFLWYFCLSDMAKRSTAKKSDEKLLQIRDKKIEVSGAKHVHPHEKYLR